MIFVYFVVNVLDKINRPSRLRRAISFDLSICQLAKLRPTMRAIVIVIIIVIIGEAELVDHDGGIIAQSYSSNWRTLANRLPTNCG